jgi:hypothetical protein
MKLHLIFAIVLFLAFSVSSSAAPAELSETDMTKIFQTSFAAYPWRMNETVTTKSSNQTITGLIEAQSGLLVHTISNQDIQGAKAAIEVILVSSDVYAKVDGIPADQLKPYGIDPGKWTKLPEKSEFAETFGKMALIAANPTQLLASVGFQNLKGHNQTPYKLTGTEQINGNAASVYEATIGSASFAAAHRVSISTDNRILKMTSNGPLTTTTIAMEYDPSIKITAPAP